MSNVQAKLPTKFKIAIIILSVLLVISLGALATRAMFLHNKAESATVVVPNNYLGKTPSAVDAVASTVVEEDENDQGESAASSNGASSNVNHDPNATPGVVVQQNESASLLEFYQGRKNVNKKFEVHNMVPGDSNTKYFCVRAHHSKDVELVFEAEVTEQTRLLGNVLDVVVTDTVNNKVICEGTFNEINGTKYSSTLAANETGKTVSFFRIDVSMDTSVGNPYQVARLLADLHWYIEEDDGLDPLPQTGDTTRVVLWVVVAVSAMTILFLLLLIRKREEEEEEEYEYEA